MRRYREIGHDTASAIFPLDAIPHEYLPSYKQHDFSFQKHIIVHNALFHTVGFDDAHNGAHAQCIAHIKINKCTQ